MLEVAREENTEFGGAREVPPFLTGARLSGLPRISALDEDARLMVRMRSERAYSLVLDGTNEYAELANDSRRASLRFVSSRLELLNSKGELRPVLFDMLKSWSSTRSLKVSLSHCLVAWDGAVKLDALP